MEEEEEKKKGNSSGMEFLLHYMKHWRCFAYPASDNFYGFLDVLKAKYFKVVF